MASASVWPIRPLARFGSPASRLALAEGLLAGQQHAAALRLLGRLAKGGMGAAQYQLGRCYLLGLGVPASLSEALRWLRRAAEAGDPAAQSQLAALALQGAGDGGGVGLFDGQAGEPDFGRAAYWCRRAMATGSAEATALLGFILTSGPAELRDVAAGAALYRASAAAGWPRGQLGAAMAALTDGELAEATRLLQAAAETGAGIAHCALAMLSEAAGDPAAAAEGYRKAAEQGHRLGQARYGFALLQGRGLAADRFEAETWLRRAALAGEASAAAVIGFLYLLEDGPPRHRPGAANHAEAAFWLRSAAEAGHIPAARTLGRMLLHGRGVREDVAEAARWLRVAAEAGDAAARFELGLCLAHGIGTERDGAAALGSIRQAAAAGHDEARRLLAELAEPRHAAGLPQNCG